mgnify:CR=1 FL=1
MLKLVFQDIDNCISKTNFRNDGSTSLSVLLSKNFAKIFHLGDSRALVVTKNGNFIQVTDEHNTMREDEINRITKLGGWVLPVGNVMRVQGSLTITRSFGDFSYKPFISSEPEIINFELKEEHRYMVIATDGLWNVIS